MSYPMVTETTVQVSQFADSRGERDDIVLWNDEGLGVFLAKMAWLENSTVVHELAYESGLLEVGSWTEEEMQHFRDQEELRAAYEGWPFETKEFINDPEIERALDVWREQDNMDDISEPSYFKQWDQSLNGSTWILDGNPQNLDPVLLTPEMLQQTDKLNILLDAGVDWCVASDIPWDSSTGVIVPNDQLCTLELVATGANYGVAKCQYGGVFVTKGTLAFLQRTFGAGQVGDKFRCWISFDGTRKHPWRTVVNGIESYEYEDLRAYQ